MADGANTSNQAVKTPEDAKIFKQIAYHSYFEQKNDNLSDEVDAYKLSAYLRTVAADREQDYSKKMSLYVESIGYSVLTGVAMEQHSSKQAAYEMHLHTLATITDILTKFELIDIPVWQKLLFDRMNIFVLRYQSFVLMRLFKLKELECYNAQDTCYNYFKYYKPIPGGVSNNSVSIYLPNNVHTALYQQTELCGSLLNCHKIWEQADRLVVQGNHAPFFIDIDRKMGPFTFHSNAFAAFKYVEEGLQRLLQLKKVIGV